MKKIILCGHTGSCNRGCEAIVRSICKIIRQNIPDAEIILATHNKHQDIALGIDKETDKIIEYNNIKKFSFNYFWYGLWQKVFKNNYISQWIVQRKLWKEIDKDTLLLNIGGDIYCYSRPNISYALNQYAAKKGAKTILFACSIEKDVIDEKMKEDLNKYYLIFARESITYKNLINAGIPKYKLRLYPDPAFALDLSQTDTYDDFFALDDVIGINLSPTVMESGKDCSLVLENYNLLVKHILENTSFNILLIPHVYCKDNLQDLMPLKELYSKYKSTERIAVIEEMQNCMQLKEIISRCKMFIGARTHSTIAAYSTCVPTLAVGYSVKAKGIAKDIFGTDNDMVMPVQSLQKEDDLINAFEKLLLREDWIRKHLQSVMPKYCAKSMASGKEIADLLKGV